LEVLHQRRLVSHERLIWFRDVARSAGFVLVRHGMPTTLEVLDVGSVDAATLGFLAFATHAGF
jgi:hypothetical protein